MHDKWYLVPLVCLGTVSCLAMAVGGVIGWALHG